MCIGKILELIFVFSFLLTGAGFAQDSSDEDWSSVIMTAQESWYDWYYAQIKPDVWQVYSDDDYIKGQYEDDDPRAVVYRDEIRKLTYPLIIDPTSKYAKVVAGEKIELCGISTAVITLRRNLNHPNSAIPPDFDDLTYGYERIFLNLEKEGQILQLYDSYSVHRMIGNVPLAEFLQVTNFTCGDGFITVFTDDENKRFEWGK